MLPYSPLHHVLMRELGVPVIATSGNKTDDPIAIENTEAIRRLRDIADYFPKIKVNGVIGGHDYTPFHKGVRKAVNEFAAAIGRFNFHAIFPDWFLVKEHDN